MEDWEIDNDSFGYYIRYKDGNVNKWIAKNMNISLRKVISVMVKHNGRVNKDLGKHSSSRFENYSDAENAMQELQSLIVANVLINN